MTEPLLEQRKRYVDVMECFHRGELRHSTRNEIVTDERVAKAIAMRIAGLSRQPRGSRERRETQVNLFEEAA